MMTDEEEDVRPFDPPVAYGVPVRNNYLLQQINPQAFNARITFKGMDEMLKVADQVIQRTLPESAEHRLAMLVIGTFGPKDWLERLRNR